MSLIDIAVAYMTILINIKVTRREAYKASRFFFSRKNQCFI